MALHGVTIAVLQQFQTTVELGIFLVVEVIDILDVSVERVEETYRINATRKVGGS
jgi:hypothetical protein